jgi:hypothetical protein
LTALYSPANWETFNTPSAFLHEHPQILDKFALTDTLERFEKLFKRLNTILELTNKKD